MFYIKPTTISKFDSGTQWRFDYYNFEKVTKSLKEKEQIESPIQMDVIEFKEWNNTKLEFTCDEFLN